MTFEVSQTFTVQEAFFEALRMDEPLLFPYELLITLSSQGKNH